jgi:hypothetical protein
MKIKRGSTSVRRLIFIGDSSSTTGAGLANLTHNSSGLVCYYFAGDLSDDVQVSLVAPSGLGSYTSGGFIAVDNTNMPGWYEIGIPNAALDGGNEVAIQLRGATNMAPLNIYIELDSVDYQDAVRFGVSALPNASAGANGGLPIGDGSGRVLLQPTQTGVTIPTVQTVELVNELASTALAANAIDEAIAILTWQQLTTATWPTDSFGKQVLIGSSTQRSVAVTGSHHVASVLHDAEPNSIPEDAFVTGALSARALAADAATEIATAVGTLQVLARLDSMIESDGAGQFRFDTIALENAPSGGGGGGGGGTDWTSSERSAIRSILGFNSSGTVVDPSVGILDEIRDKTALITSGTVQTALPVTASGQITSPLVIGDDYLAANGRAFSWTVALPPGFVAATASCRFGMRFEDETGVNSFVSTGTVTDAGSGNVTLSFDVAKTVTGDLRPGWYDWSVEIVSASGTEITRVKSGKNAEWQEKQT